MRYVIQLINHVTEWSGRVISFFIYPGFLLLAYEVFMRYFVKAPSVWTLGMSQRFFAVYYLMAGAYALLYNSHIRMDIIFNRFHPRTRALFDLILTYPLLFTVCFVFIWHGTQYAWTSILQRELDNTAFMAPVWPVKLFIPLGGILLFLQGISKFYPTLMLVLTKKSWEEKRKEKER
jgi:TRAP-type mannitol/chloroaromatic compound transport system permease small subunit